MEKFSLAIDLLENMAKGKSIIPEMKSEYLAAVKFLKTGKATKASLLEKSGNISPLPHETRYLRRIMTGQVCLATDGKKIFSQKQGLLQGLVNSDLKIWNSLNKPGVATTDTIFDVYELHSEGNEISIFRSLVFGRPLTKLCFSTAQVVEIVENNFENLCSGFNNLVFLIRGKQGYFFQIYFFRNHRGIHVSVDGFNEDDNDNDWITWSAAIKSTYFVVPQNGTAVK